MKTKNLVALAIAFVVVALLTVLAVTGVQIGKNIVIPVTDGITRGGDLQKSAYGVYTVTVPVEETAPETEATDATEAPAETEATDTTEVPAETEATDAAEAPKDLATLLDETIAILRVRANMQSLPGTSVTKLGDDKIRIEIPTDNDELASSTLTSLTREGHVTFRDADGETFMDGERIVSTNLSYDNNTATYYVSFMLDEQGKAEFAGGTAAAVGSSISIYNDDTLVNSANISEPLTEGTASIGLSSYTDARDLLIAMNSGRLETVLTETATGAVPANVSDAKLTICLIALAVALLAAIAVLLIVYKAMGFVSAISLLLTIVLTLFFFGLVPYISFNFASLFGLIAVAVVKLFCDFDLMNRTKAELPSAFTPKAAVATAFHINVLRSTEYCLVSVGAALVIQYFGNSPITGFSSVFAIGSILAYLITMFVTRPLMGCAVDIKAASAKQ